MHLISQHRAVVTALAVMPSDGYETLSDDEVLALTEVVAEAEHLISTHAALLAGQLARRSESSLGAAGLAQRLGHRTPEELLRVTTGSTLRAARTAVDVGRIVTTPELRPWLTPVAIALSAGGISVDGAASIRNGLGMPTESVSAEMLRDAAEGLCAIDLDADRIFTLARAARDAIDEVGIADREAQLRQKRSLRFWRTSDGGAQLHWVLDAESAAIVAEVIDRMTSPRRGGPRFVDPSQSKQADGILVDTRTTEQLTSDGFVELLRQGADADPTQLLGTGAPVIRVLVAETHLARKPRDSTRSRACDEPQRSGFGRIEGSAVPISIETVERLVCGADVAEVKFDDSGQVLDVGREQRLYTRRQRIALAARDGGCRWPGCERPPSWTEAHHTRHWARDHGSTSIEDGILLCRHHHLLTHNNHWEISHIGGDYSLIPPPEIDPQQVPIEMPSHSAALLELLGAG